MSGIRRFLDFVGNMGLLARGDPPRVVDLTGREWGEAVNGFSLSARQVARQDADELPSVSVVLRNAGSAPQVFSVPGWMAFYQFRVLGPDGAEVPLSAYGSHLLQSRAAVRKRQRFRSIPALLRKPCFPSALSTPCARAAFTKSESLAACPMAPRLFPTKPLSRLRPHCLSLPVVRHAAYAFHRFQNILQ